MKNNKGISLIVLVITIIVMTILAGAIILTLTNSGIIDRASEAMNKTNFASIKEIAELAWAEAYMNKAETDVQFYEYVKEALQKNKITEKDYEGYTMIVTTEGVKFIEDYKIVPEGAVYYVGGKYKDDQFDATDATIYNPGDIMPDTVSTGDTYIYGDYRYIYNYAIDPYYYYKDERLNGWGCTVESKLQTTYGKILESINGKPITGLVNLFSDCTKLTNLPKDFEIPKYAKNIVGMFCNSSIAALPNNFKIPNGVEYIADMFNGCSQLTSLPENCIIPNSVKDMAYVFAYCSALEGVITINANLTDIEHKEWLYEDCFRGTKKPIVITGTCTMLDELAKTATNNNVTVNRYFVANYTPNPNGTIPKAATYYVGVTSTKLENYTGATATYNAGDAFPKTPKTGDVFTYGEYEYRYNQYYEYEASGAEGYWKTITSQQGWGARLINMQIEELVNNPVQTINNIPIVSMRGLFSNSYIEEIPESFSIPQTVRNVEGMLCGCCGIEEIPSSFKFPDGITSLKDTFNCCGCGYELKLPDNFTIPSTVTNMNGTFGSSCLSSLPENFKLPEGLIDMTYTFGDCNFSELPERFTIPESVTTMEWAFGYCYNLKSLPNSFIVPSKVTNIEGIFIGCESLTGEIKIDANPTKYTGAFAYCDMSKITLTGSSTMLETLKQATTE